MDDIWTKGRLQTACNDDVSQNYDHDDPKVEVRGRANTGRICDVSRKSRKDDLFDAEAIKTTRTSPKDDDG